MPPRLIFSKTCYMPTTPGASPLRASDRLRIIDALRGIALLGILLMNILMFGLPDFQADNLVTQNEFSGANYYAWWVISLFFEGTMRGIFSLLFGAGCVLLLERLEKKTDPLTPPADIYFRRLLWLLLFGLIDANFLLWSGDVLYVYALGGMLLYPFRRLKARTLLIIAGVALLVGTLLGTVHMYESKELRVNGEKALALEQQKVRLTADQQKHKEAWEEHVKKHTPEAQRKADSAQVAKMRGGYFTVMAWSFPRNAELQNFSPYDLFYWDLVLCFILGMALFKMGVLTGARSPAFYGRMLLIGYAVGLSINYWVLSSIVAVRFDETRIADHTFISWYEIRRVAMLLGHIGLIMLLYKSGIVNRLFGWLAAVGQMAFTNYLMQSILCGLFFYGFGLGWYGALERYQLYYVVAGVWVLQIIYSNIWLHYFLFGPFEWIWRSLTYWQRQPFRRNVPVMQIA